MNKGTTTEMNIKQRLTICSLMAAFGLLIFLGVYARIWEARQEKQHLLDVKVLSIESYGSSNDLHWSLSGYRVYIVGEDKPIDFSLKNWDNSVQVGDTVEAVIRQSFPWFGLKDEWDGLSVDDHKSVNTNH